MMNSGKKPVHTGNNGPTHTKDNAPSPSYKIPTPPPRDFFRYCVNLRDGIK